MTGSLPNPSPQGVEEQTKAFDAYRRAFNRYHAHPTPLRYQAFRVSLGRFLTSFGIEGATTLVPHDQQETKRGRR